MKDVTIDELNAIAQTLFDKKGSNILILDVRGVSSITDYMIFANGTVDRHVSALGNAVIDLLQKQGNKPSHVEGTSSDWMVIDYTNIMIHLFTDELRQKYQLEQVWKAGKVVDVKIQTKPTLSMPPQPNSSFAVNKGEV